MLESRTSMGTPWRIVVGIAVVLGAPAAFPGAALAATVALGGEQGVPAGGIAELPVIATSAEPRGGVELTLRYDPALLELISVSNGAAPSTRTGGRRRGSSRRLRWTGTRGA
ncbi:MAG: hypothetical protein HYV63_14085 [Candidatus Schekmanbacteria bacterium]|nr:hypothetical protein [Candidatus Schekmanbacteria bacterium]